MLKKYRNSLLQLVRAAELDPLKFTSKEKPISINYVQYEGYHLSLESSSIAFIIATRFINAAREYCCAALGCQIAENGPMATPGTWSNWTSDFGRIEEAFTTWLNSAGKKYFAFREEEEEDLATPDLWAELKASPDAAEDFRVLKNTRFSPQEQTRIADTLAQFEAEVERRQLLSPDEIKELHEQVNYLIEASKRLGRKDWVLVVTGTLFSFTIQAGLNGATASQLLQLATGGLQWIVTHIPLLTP